MDQGNTKSKLDGKWSFGAGVAFGAVTCLGISLAIPLGIFAAGAAGMATTIATAAGSGVTGLLLGGAVGLAGVGATFYGTYRGIKAAWNAVNRHAELDKPKMAIGAVAGFFGMMFIPVPGLEDEPVQRYDFNRHSISEPSRGQSRTSISAPFSAAGGEVILTVYRVGKDGPPASAHKAPTLSL